mgnify:CR=1 FL=1
MSKIRAKKQIVVYTDGSCSKNGKYGAIGGIGIHFPNEELEDISKVFRLGCCTNQRTELYAILTALRYVHQNFDLKKYQIHIKTDSRYSIDSITKWVKGWIKNGWKTKNNTPVANRELIETIYKYYQKYDVKLSHVSAHTGYNDPDSLGNAEADRLATKATKRAMKELQKNIMSKNSHKIKNNYHNTKKYIFNSNEIPKDGCYEIELVRNKN